MLHSGAGTCQCDGQLRTSTAHGCVQRQSKAYWCPLRCLLGCTEGQGRRRAGLRGVCCPPASHILLQLEQGGSAWIWVFPASDAHTAYALGSPGSDHGSASSQYSWSHLFAYILHVYAHIPLAYGLALAIPAPGVGCWDLVYLAMLAAHWLQDWRRHCVGQASDSWLSL